MEGQVFQFLFDMFDVQVVGQWCVDIEDFLGDVVVFFFVGVFYCVNGVGVFGQFDQGDVNVVDYCYQYFVQVFYLCLGIQYYGMVWIEVGVDCGYVQYVFDQFGYYWFEMFVDCFQGDFVFLYVLIDDCGDQGFLIQFEVCEDFGDFQFGLEVGCVFCLGVLCGDCLLFGFVSEFVSFQ